jgi:hypothetical protein
MSVEEDVQTPSTTGSARVLLHEQHQLRDMYLVLYPKSLEDEVVKVLEAVGVPGYTEFPKLHGRGRTLRHFENQVWPGSTGAIVTVVDPAQSERVAESLTRLDATMEQRSHHLNGLHLFSWPCHQVI